MNSQDNPPLLRGRNPFPATAVARATETESGRTTIETASLKAAQAHLDSYLESNPVGEQATGGVLAVVGEYGSGKTHLAGNLIRRVRNSANARVMYLDAPAGYIDSTGKPFVGLYRRFFEQLIRADVFQRVREYYAEVVADSLGETPLTASAANEIRTLALDPQVVVDRLGLVEGSLLDEVQRRLSAVTDREQFGSALTLLLRSGFEGAVWEWLRGEPPDAILVERGILTAIQTEADALEAMGVFALLYGRRGHKLVLVIDELEKLLAESDTPAEDIQAFRKLLEVCSGAGTFLILIGLRDFLDALGEDVSRIGAVVRMSTLSADEVEEYVRRTLQLLPDQSRGDGLFPFDSETISYIVSLADGVARKVVLLCHHAYRRSTESQAQVTPVMLREIARSHIGVAGPEDARASVERLLRAEGLDFRSRYKLGDKPASTADYWISSSNDDSGIALVLADSVLAFGEVENLGLRRLGILEAAPQADVLLIVTGYLATGLKAGLADRFQTEPLLYDQRSFETDLATTVRSIGRRRYDDHADPIGAIQDRMERLGRQQSNTQGAIEQVTVFIDELRSSFVSQLVSLERTIQSIGPVTPTVKGAGVERAVSPLPTELQESFAQADAALHGLRQVETVVKFVFEEAASDQASNAKNLLRRELRSDDSFLGISVSFLLRRLLMNFREALERWYRQNAPGKDDFDARSFQEVDALCRNFDAAYEYLPLYRLAALEDWIPEGSSVRDLGLGAGRASEEDFRAVFDDFAGRVWEIVQNR